jgi:RNA polymerase sigma-70 factor, ECF subfamily
MSVVAGRPSDRHDASAIGYRNDPESVVGSDEDRQLVLAARTDAEAVALLYRRHVRAVYAHSYSRCGSKEVAEEATSATFERALLALGTFEWRDGGVRPWLCRIASNEVAAIYRRQAREASPRSRQAMQQLTVDADADNHDDRQTADRDALVMDAVRAALPRLPNRYREVIELRYLGGLGPAEAAERLGCSKPVLAVTLHRALSALRKEISQQEQGATR